MSLDTRLHRACSPLTEEPDTSEITTIRMPGEVLVPVHDTETGASVIGNNTLGQ